MKKLNRSVYAAAGVLALLMAGVIYSWSVLSRSIAASRPDWTSAQLSLTFTLVVAFFCIGGFIAGLYSKKIKPRIFILLSAVLIAAGLLLASVTKSSLLPLYIGFGVMVGLGSGFAYNPVMGTISAWFPDKQGLVSGILTMGFGFSSFIIGKVFAAAAPADGSDAWAGVFRLFAVVMFVVLVITSFFLFRPDAGYAPPAGNKKKVVREPAMDITTSQMIRMPLFWVIYVWAIFESGAGLALVGQASGIAAQVGQNVSGSSIATVVGLISIMNGASRVFYGAVYDKKGYKLTQIIIMVGFIITSLLLIFAIRSGNYAMVVIGFLLGGFAYGGVPAVQSPIISDFFGRTNYALNFSLICTNLLIGSFASTIAGKLYDSTQSYMSTVMMMLICTVISFVLFLFIKRPTAKK